MKSRETLKSIRLLLVVGFLAAAPFSIAQSRSRRGAAASDSGRPAVVLRKLTGTGSRSVIRTPSYDTTYGRGSKAAKEWGIVQVEYDSYPEWIDELTITFHALSLEADGSKEYALYRRDVRYMDIKEGREHLAAVYLRPSALLRFGEVVAVAVEFSIDGRIVAGETDTVGGVSLPNDWWKNPAVLKSDLVKRRDGYMLNRAESPFAYVAIDDYEAIK